MSENVGFAYLLGIRRTEDIPGWTKITVSPMMVPQLKRASGFVTVPAGKVTVSYEIVGDEVRFAVTVPAGVDACFDACGVRQKLGAGENRIVCRL